MKKIKIATAQVEMEAELNESSTAQEIWEALPLEGKVNTWGEEIYFSIPVKKEAEDAVETVAVGDIAYWPQGNAFCIFFGKTPVSREGEVRAAGPVNVVGRLLGEPKKWKEAVGGETISLEKI